MLLSNNTGCLTTAVSRVLEVPTRLRDFTWKVLVIFGVQFISMATVRGNKISIATTFPWQRCDYRNESCISLLCCVFCLHANRPCQHCLHNYNVSMTTCVIFFFQGKMQVEDKGAQGFSQPHNFNKHTFLTPTNCDYCLQMIIGFVSKGGLGYLL